MAESKQFDDDDLSRELLRRAHEAAGIGTYTIDLDAQVIHLSAEMAYLLRAGEGARSMPLAEYRERFHHPDDRAAAVAKAEAGYARRDQVDLDTRVIRGDGQLIWVRASSTTHTGSGGRRLVVGVVQDVTERKLAVLRLGTQAHELEQLSQSLAASEALLRQFIAHTPAAVAMFDREMRYLQVSKRWITDYHLDGHDVLGRSHYDVFPDIPERWKAIHRRALAGARERCAEDPFPRADGTLDWLEWDVQPWRDAAGDIGGIIMFTQVITERKREEEQHRRSEYLFRALAENSLVGIFVRTGDAITYVNPAIERMFGYARDELIGRPPEIVIHPDDRGFATGVMARRLAGELDEVQLDVRGVRKDGSTLRIVVYGFAAELGGQPSVVGNIVDITERREIEDRFRALSESSLAGVYIAQDDLFVYVNPALEAMYESAPGVLVGTEVLAIIHPDDRARVAEAIRRRTAGQLDLERYETRALTARGREIWVEVLGARMLHRGRPATFGHVVDITARKRAEAELQRSEQRWRTFIEDAPVGIGVQRDGHTLYFNNRLRQMWRYPSLEAVLGRPVSEMWAPPFDRDVMERARARTHREGAASYAGVGRRTDGTTFPAHVDVVTLELPDGPAGIAFITDTTERENLEQQLRHSQKMEAIGVLAGGIAHDFNNLLAVILTYAHLVMDELPDGDPRREDLAEIAAAGERAARMTRQLLTFSRQQAAEPHVVDLDEVVASCEKMLRRLIGEHIELTTTPSAVGPEVFVDPGQIEQVLMNLVVNARDAMPDGGRLTIDVAVRLLAEPDPARGLAAGRWATLTVTDTGTGMDAETRTRIFEPFFTTKAVGKGTGLGLSTVFGIVRQSQGHIDVESELGHGTTFRIWLPFATSERITAEHAAVAPELRGRETILLVEDDDAVRRVVRTVLRKHGYQVLECRSGGDAIVVADDHAGAIDLLLTDMVMPLMSGEQLYERMRSRRPAMRVAFMSGYPDKAVESRARLAGAHFVQKPFTPDVLLARVRDVLA